MRKTKLFNGLIMAVILLMAATLSAQTYSGGSGTEGAPYQIATTDDLIELSNTSGDWDKNFIQTADIAFAEDETQVDWDGDGSADGSGTSGFSPIGTDPYNEGTAFTGSYDGQNHTINHLYVNRPQIWYVGLFGYVLSNDSNTEIKNLGLKNINLTGYYGVGGLVGTLDNASINNCFTTGSISNNPGMIGGIVGSNWGVINNSYADVNVSSEGNNVGGFIGEHYGYNGEHYNSKINNCYAIGNVSGDDTQVGGFVGYIGSYEVSAVIRNCYSNGDVTRSSGTGTDFGAFCGYCEGENIIENSYAAGSVFESEGVAWSSGDKGFVGEQNPDPTPTYNNNFFDTGSNQTSATGATGLTSANMQVQSNFTNWDFTDIWTMSSSITFGGYPTLQWTDAYAETPSGSPYQITSLPNLVWIAEDDTRWSNDYEQTAVIDAWTTPSWDDGKGWTPIGNTGTKFTGSYDGGGYTIDNLFINRPLTDYISLFGYTHGATISNLGVTNVDVTGGNMYFGGLVGYISNNSIVSNSYSAGSVNGPGHSAGGLVGGANVSSTVNNSYSTANVNGHNWVGGLVGDNIDASTVSNSYSTGEVNGNAAIGGLVGYNEISATVENSYITGSVTGTLTYVGGLVGYNDNSTIKNSYSTGSVSGSGNIGGLVGSNNKTVENSFWNTVTSGQNNSDGGTGKTTSEMTNATTTNNIYLDAGWDFKGESTNGSDDIWNIGNARNDGYPYLDWQYPADPATLPVTLSSFTAMFANNSPVLQWETQSEDNNQGWNIYRSQDDLENATQINVELIPGAGTTSQITLYSYNDELDFAAQTEYFYWLESVDSFGQTELYGPVSLVIPEDQEDPETPDIPINYGLSNHPNPFNPATTINFAVRETGVCQIVVYDCKGRKIRTLFNETAQANTNYSLLWNGCDDNGNQVSSGVYFYKLRSADKNYTRKMLLLK
jgi:hypothetical protein